MKKSYLLLVTVLLCFNTLAQKNGIVKGIVFDTAAKQPVAGATITLLQKKDSSLVTFTMTDNTGSFDLGSLANGDYRLMITHVNYHNRNRFFTISDAAKTKDLGQIAMTDVSTMLDSVVVTAEAPPVTLVGDTIQYNAGSFKAPPNSNVEQLLKKMPGIRVEKDGTVKAQGQEVKRVLVDGKEFFGTDPKVATRNLPADAVDKVQVYDRSSDQAQLTGFDDGNSEKTINLKLKKDKKKGLFGKATAGGGTKDRYEGRFNVNSFKGARQLSVIGMANNTNSEGFSFTDMLNFTGELSRLQRSGGGNIQISANDGMAGMGDNNNGSLRTIWGGGINYNNIIGKKTDFTSNYFYNHYNPNTDQQTSRQYFLKDSSYFYNRHSNSDNINNSHRLNLGADIYIDSFHSIKINPSIGYQQTRNKTYSEFENLSNNKMIKGSEGYSNTFSNSEGFNFRNDLLFRKKFRRRGRTFSLSLQTSINETEGNGGQESVSRFYMPANRTDSVNQRNTTTGNLYSYTARAVYTEPILPKTLLELSASKSNTRSTSEKITYNYNKLNSQYDLINDELSNDFSNTYGFTNAGIRFRYQQKKFSAAVGANWQQAELEGKIISGTKDSIIGKTFTNLLPNARLQYAFSQYRRLNLYYTASTNQPSVSQLQPVPDITNPFNISSGNPNLKQEYTHAAQLNFNSVNPFRNKNLFAFFVAQYTQNKIVNYDSLDAYGVKYTSPVNVNGVFNVRGDVSVGLPVRLVKGTIDFGIGMQYSKGKQFLNKIENNINTLNLGPQVRLNMNPTTKLDITLSGSVSYYKTGYSIQSALNTTYFNQVYGADVNWQLPASFFLSTEFSYTINTRRADGFNTNVPLWNASLSKQFLRYNRGEVKFTVFDLLNENVNITRNTNQNYIEDLRVRTLQRFFMLSFTYSLSKNGLGSARGAEQGIRVIRR
jgi:hypothetical protein